MAYTTIDDPTIYFNTVLYTGDGTSSKAITGVGFQPDWVWLKARNHAYSHQLFDVVRGASQLLSSEESSAEQTLSGVSSFDSDGFTVGSDAGSNGSAKTFASWNWKAGGSASSNSDGDITSSVSVSTDAGLSIVSYTGSGTDSDTVGHGLGAAPKMIILKKRNALDNWYVMHTSLTTNNSLNLDTTNAQRSTSVLTYGVLSTSPTSSTFSFAAGGGAVPTGNVNNSGSTYIAYCFAEKKGYSKFFSYEGNSNSDGPFVYLGFRPAWLMVKPIDASDNWVMFDNKRHNALNSSVSPYFLYANKNFAETTDTKLIDFLSNGFKIRASGNTVNRSSTFIGMAFAEQPFVNSSGIPCNAR